MHWSWTWNRTYAKQVFFFFFLYRWCLWFSSTREKWRLLYFVVFLFKSYFLVKKNLQVILTGQVVAHLAEKEKENWIFFSTIRASVFSVMLHFIRFAFLPIWSWHLPDFFFSFKIEQTNERRDYLLTCLGDAMNSHKLTRHCCCVKHFNFLFFFFIFCFPLLFSSSTILKEWVAVSSS
jgi:hypothetical protein